MNLTKRSLCILMALAVVFTTLVFVSVSASIDFPIHETIVSYSGGSTMNCKDSKPGLLANNKIAYVNVQNIDSIGAQFIADASNLYELVENAEITGKTVNIDVYSEYSSELKKASINARMLMGGNWVEVNNQRFENGKIITFKITANSITGISGVNKDNLNSVGILFTPEAGDKITGSFYMSAPYIDGAQAPSSVNVTSFKTTTTKADEDYDGNIVVYQNEASYSGYQDKKNANITIGNLKGYENRYVHMDGDAQQIQVMNMYVDGLQALRKRAIDNDKQICIDVYANNFTNNTSERGRCDFVFFFNNGGQNIGDKSESRITVRAGIKRTIVISPDILSDKTNGFNLNIQNYSYGDQKSIKNGKFILSVPYIDGDKASSAFTPSTTAPPTVPEADYDGSKITVYKREGLNYNGTKSYIKPTNDSLSFGGEFGDDKKSYRYIQVAGGSSKEGNGYMIQLGGVGIDGLQELKNTAVKNEEKIYMDIYATDLNRSCYFKADFGKTTGDKDRIIKNGKKQTLTIDPSLISDGRKSISFYFLNYENSDASKNEFNGKFIISLPYLKSDIDNAELVTPEEITTQPTTTLPDVVYPDGTLPIKSKDSVSSFTSGGWSNPDGGMVIAADKKTANVISKAPYSQFQMYLPTTNFSELILDAIKKNKSICIDFYGNFLVKGKTGDEVVARAAVDFGGGKWFGKLPDKDISTNDNQNDFIDLKPNQVYTAKWDPKALLEIYRSIKTTTAAPKDVFEVESIKTSGDAEYSVYKQNDVESTATMHEFKNTSVGQYVEYVIPNQKAGTYNISLSSKDYTKRGVFEAYINGNKVNNSIDFRSSSKVYKDHSIAKYTLLKDGDIKIKLVCTKASLGDISMSLDKISVKDANVTTTTEHESTDEEIAAKFTRVHAVIKGQAWNQSTVYGRFYMTVPYIEGAEDTGDVEAETTTTTRSLPSQPTGSDINMPSGGWNMEKRDLDYVDCRYSSVDWAIDGVKDSNGNIIYVGSTATRMNSGRYVKFGLRDDGKAQQVGGQLVLNGGNVLKSFSEYVEYAKEAGAMLAIDVYPKFKTDSGDVYCHMNATWRGSTGFKWPVGNKDFKLVSGKKFTYYISPYDIPDDARSVDFRFDSYEYSPGIRRLIDVDICVTAPYLAGEYDAEKTSTTTTTTTKTPVRPSTNPYPSQNAGGTTKFSIPDTKVAPGGSLRVPINISGNEGIYSAKFSVKFNTGALTLTGCKKGDIFDVIEVSDTDDANTSGVVTFLAQSNGGNVTKNGTVLYLEFDATDVEDDYLISFAGTGFLPSNFFNYDSKNVPCSFVSGYVVVGAGGTRPSTTDPDAHIPYPKTNSGTTKFTIDSINETFVQGAKYKDYTVNISISGNTGLSGAKFSVKYDNTKLKFLSSTVVSSAKPVFNLVDYDFKPNEDTAGVLTYDINAPYGAPSSASTNNGKIVSLKFRLLNYAAGNYSIEFGGDDYEAKNYKNISGAEIPCSFTSGGIVVKAPASLSKVSTPTVKLTAKTQAKISWKSVKNATSYEVYRAIGASKSFIKIATVKSTSYTHKNLKAGIKYTYKVRAINSYVTGSYSSVKSISTMNYKTKVTLKSVASTGKVKLKVSIKNKIAGATGYQIQCSLSKKFKSVKKVTTKKLTTTITKLKSKKTYYVKARTYNVVNGKKVYGKWSTIKVKKTK